MNQNFFYLTLIILSKSCIIISQNSVSLTPISLVQPKSCPSNQYFDISHLTCVNCPANSESSDSKQQKF